ncbi:MAG: succinate dehydrogenase/fumarate reductase iron-sulfur subunit [Burkholderiales bacterium]
MDRLDARHIGQAENRDTLGSKLNALKDGDTITARVQRFTPGEMDGPRYETFKVPYQKWMRVLDVLIHISEELDSDLSYRWYCGSKMCGSCAMRVNGREVLACWAAAEPDMTIEPLRNLPVMRDLTVDRRPYEKRFLALEPWIHRASPYPGFPEPLTQREMRFTSEALDCISCAACYSACPVVGLGEVTKFSGPAPLVQLAQAALDPRDSRERWQDLIEQASVFSCISCYRCEEVCPAGIPIVSKVIEPLKALAYRMARDKPRHPRVFLEIVRRRGRIDPSELVLRVQGMRALRGFRRVMSLLLNGKISPWATLLGKPIPGMQHVRRLFRTLLRTS